MAHQPSDAVHGGLGEAAVREEVPDQGGTLQLLILSVCIAVLLPAEGAGDVVDNGGDFQNILGCLVQALALADGFGEGPDLHKMVHVVPVSVGVRYHFPGNFRSGHWSHSPCTF